MTATAPRGAAPRTGMLLATKTTTVRDERRPIEQIAERTVRRVLAEQRVSARTQGGGSFF